MLIVSLKEYSTNWALFQESTLYCMALSFLFCMANMIAILYLTAYLGLSSAISLWNTKEVEYSYNKSDPYDYGVDVSYPIHHFQKKSFFRDQYEKTMAGCYAKYSKRQCDANDLARMEMTRDQPRSQHNYTELGFKKTRVPLAAWEPLLQFYLANKHKEQTEAWPPGCIRQ